MSASHNASATRPILSDFGLSQGLEAQRQLLPWALGLFAACLPVYVLVATGAEGAAWLAGSLFSFGVSLAGFLAAARWLATGRRELGERLRVQTLSALIWAVSLAQVAAFAAGAGAPREALLTLAMAGACLVMVFCAPVLECLLIVAPVAAAGPVAALLLTPSNSASDGLAWTSLALGMTMSLVLHLTLRRQFAIAAEREELIRQRSEAQDKAERLARSKSHLLATLSHEIRNGMSGVIHVLAGAAGHGERAAPPTRAQLAAALNAAHDLIGVLDATLDTETAEQGAMAFQKTPFEPVRLAEELALLYRPQAAAKGLELNFFAEPALVSRLQGMAVGDPARVRQILSNLIVNAVKYTLRGRIELRIEVADGNRLLFSIADTGPGLSFEELESAFEPFRRVSRTGAGVPGAGLGLSLAKQLSNLMGGELHARSAVGAGSCFTLSIPYDSLAARLSSGQNRDEQPVGAASRSLRVLLAEDDALSAAMLRAVLEQLGHQVVHAQNGLRAVELCKIGEFDLMVFDGRMPGMDGAAATRAVRALPGPNACAPIIAVIAGEPEEADACLAAGADTVLRKPLSVASLARAVVDAMTPDTTAVKRAVA